MSLSYEQRCKNVAAIAARRRAKETCTRGHDNWRIRPDGRRVCRTCQNDRSWYHKHGMKFI